jgi:hypothetical protein
MLIFKASEILIFEAKGTAKAGHPRGRTSTYHATTEEIVRRITLDQEGTLRKSLTVVLGGTIFNLPLSAGSSRSPADGHRSGPTREKMEDAFLSIEH